VEGEREGYEVGLVIGENDELVEEDVVGVQEGKGVNVGPEL
jgi:hypothetical protein